MKVDHQGKPEIGLSEAERLITQEKVHALFGAYFSSVTNTASQVAERMGIPFVNADSSSPALTERGFKWFFRTSPHDEHFSQVMFEFMKDLEKKRNVQFKSRGHPERGHHLRDGQRQGPGGPGQEVSVTRWRPRSPSAPGTTSLDAEVGRLKSANADVFLPSLYTSDAILLTRTMRNLDYNPKLLIAQNAGYTDPKFVAEMGKEAEAAITRAPFALDLAAKKPLIPVVNDMFKKLSGGRDMADVSARAFTGFLTLVDAINRAGSTEPAAIQKALRETNLPADQLLMPWTGREVRREGAERRRARHPAAAAGGSYHTIYPFDLALKERDLPAPGLVAAQVSRCQRIVERRHSETA